MIHYNNNNNNNKKKKRRVVLLHVHEVIVPTLVVVGTTVLWRMGIRIQQLTTRLTTLIMIMILLLCGRSTTTTVVVSALDHDVCIETLPDKDFVCTRDVLELRDKYDGDDGMINVGITQRVDGAEQERKAIRDVLHQMDMYFFEEVLAFPEYSYARSRCKNSNELCAFWASIGECENNRVFMLSNCPAACRFCLLLHSGLASASAPAPATSS